MLIITHDQNKFISSNYKKVDFFVEANKLALQVIACIASGVTKVDILNCIYDKIGFQINQHTLDIIMKSNDARIAFINLHKSKILEYIKDKYNKLDDTYIMLLPSELIK